MFLELDEMARFLGATHALEDLYPLRLNTTKRVFCVHYFNDQGEEVACFLPDLMEFHPPNLQEFFPPRVWSEHFKMSLTNYRQL